jgi:hypothetical protein
MKKNMALSITKILVFSVSLFGVAAISLFALQGSDGLRTETMKAGTQAAEEEKVVKTFPLKYISWREVADAARLYINDASGSENTITVRLLKRNIAGFEAILKKLDVEKKNIMFRVYTIIAARDDAPDIIKKPETKEIGNRDLKFALDEIKNLWNFKHYWVDAPSLLTVREGMLVNSFKLVSSLLDNAGFKMRLVNVREGGEEVGKRIIAVGGIDLELHVNTPDGTSASTLIDTKELSLKENGYLIVGVSGLQTGWSGLALILVISAEIK